MLTGADLISTLLQAYYADYPGTMTALLGGGSILCLAYMVHAAERDMQPEQFSFIRCVWYVIFFTAAMDYDGMGVQVTPRITDQTHSKHCVHADRVREADRCPGRCVGPGSSLHVCGSNFRACQCIIIRRLGLCVA